MSKLVLDSTKSRITIRTFAQGLLARLAHDLELVCRTLTGSAERLGPDQGTATLEIPIGEIDVAGTLKGDRVDPAGLSASDREDCLRKMHKDVFHIRSGASDVIRVEATLDAGKARVRLIPPKGRTVERPIEAHIEREDAGGTRVSGRFEISLGAIGSDPVKGPMNAFRVKDAVEISYDVFFSRAT